MEKFQVTEPNTGPLISTYSRIREVGGRVLKSRPPPKIRLLSFSAQNIRDGCEGRGGWEDKGVLRKTCGAS